MRLQSLGSRTPGCTLFVRLPKVIHILSLQGNGAESVKYEYPGVKRRVGRSALTRPVKHVVQGLPVVPDELLKILLKYPI